MMTNTAAVADLSVALPGEMMEDFVAILDSDPDFLTYITARNEEALRFQMDQDEELPF